MEMALIELTCRLSANEHQSDALLISYLVKTTIYDL